MLESSYGHALWPTQQTRKRAYLVSAIEAHSRKSQHLGFGEHVSRSNLSKSLDRKDCRVFEENAFYVFDRGYNDFKRLFHIDEVSSKLLLEVRTI